MGTWEQEFRVKTLIANNNEKEFCQLFYPTQLWLPFLIELIDSFRELGHEIVAT